MAVRPKKGAPKLKGQGVMKMVEEYQQVRKLREMYAGKESEIKKRLESIIDDQGEVDDKGHLWYELPEPVEGVSKLYKQKRVSQVMNQDIAEVLLKRLKLWDKCSTEVTVVDEDAVLALGFQGKIPEDVMAEIIEEKVSYAFYLK